MTQNETILSWLKTGAPLTALHIFKLSGSIAAHSRIADLRKQGYVIDCRRIDRDGRGMWEYRMVQDER